MRLRAGAAVLVGLMALTMASCGGDDDDSTSDGGELSAEEETSSTEESTTTTIDVETQVVDAYLAAWQAFAAASRQPATPNSPELVQTQTGAALEAANQSLRGLAESGEYIDGPLAEHSPVVRDLFPDRAVIDDCASDPSVRYAADGTIARVADPAPYAYEAVMVKENDSWKMSELILGDPCEA